MPPCTQRRWPRSEWAIMTRAVCFWINRAAKFRLSAPANDAMAPRKSALERTKSPTTQHTIPMKLEFQMVSEFGD
jgi:hypothetical protein